MDKHNIKSLKSTFKSAFKEVQSVIKTPNRLDPLDTSDAKYFQKGKANEFKVELAEPTRIKPTLKRILANISMGYDMSTLFAEVVGCMISNDLEVKKMAYMYISHYGKTSGELALLAVNCFQRDLTDSNPILRAMVIRTMAMVHNPQVMDVLVHLLTSTLKDNDAYVRKTAVLSVLKVHSYSAEMASDLVLVLKGMVKDNNVSVVANVVCVLQELNELRLESADVSRLISVLGECNEWCQLYLLEALMVYTPAEEEKKVLVERLASRLQHSNSAVVVATIRVIVNWGKALDKNWLESKLSPPLVSLLSSSSEIEYVALKNIILLLQELNLMEGQVKVFFCKYNDPVYVKLCKLEVLVKLCNEENSQLIVSELKEYCSEVDVEIVRKSIKSIGRIGIKFNPDECIRVLLELLESKVSYIVQESICVVKDLLRKYPGRYEKIIATLCQSLDQLDATSKQAMIWIIGHYSHRIENANVLLADFFKDIANDTLQVQLALLTASVELFLKRPAAGKDLVQSVMKWCCDEGSIDVRDRAYIYFRMLQQPELAKQVVLQEKPFISTESEELPKSLLDTLLLYIGTLASVYQKPPSAFVKSTKDGKEDDDHEQATQAPKPVSPVHPSYAPSPQTYAAQNSYATAVPPQSIATQKKVAANLLDFDDPLPQSPTTAVMQPMASTTEATNFAAAKQTNPLDDFLSLSLTDSKPKLVMLSNQKGLVVQGHWTHRPTTLHLTLTNSTLLPITDFDIRFNKNTWGLQSALDSQHAHTLLPNQSLVLTVQTSVQPQQIQTTQPFNVVQIALKTSIQVFYFTTNVPLHCFLVEGVLDEQAWIGEYAKSSKVVETSITCTGQWKERLRNVGWSVGEKGNSAWIAGVVGNGSARVMMAGEIKLGMLLCKSGTEGLSAVMSEGVKWVCE